MEMVLFQRQRKSTVAPRRKSLQSLMRMMPAEQFLEENKRPILLQKISCYSGLEPARYDRLYSTLITNLVNYCQSLPESINSYYALPGGLVDHALNRTEAALGLFQELIINESPELMSEEQKLWQYALFTAAILQGIGKLVVDYSIHLFDINGQLLKPWNPLLEELIDVGTYYDYEFLPESDVAFRQRLNLLMANTLMPPSGFAWIASNQRVLAVWLALLNEDQGGAGGLGALLVRADALAIQRYFAEFLLRAGLGRSGPLGRAGTFSGGVPEAIGTKEQVVGVEFIQWMMKSLEKGLIMINKAPLLMVPGGLLMCPEMFQLFVREHPEYKNWQAIQKAFLSLGVHRLAADGSLTSRFQQDQNQKPHTGIVFAEYAIALPESVSVYHGATERSDTMTAVAFIHSAQENHQFIPQGQLIVAPLNQLTASGQWQAAGADGPVSRPEVTHRG